MHQDAGVEIATGLIGEPVTQAARSVLDAARDAQLGERLGRRARTTPPAARFP